MSSSVSYLSPSTSPKAYLELVKPITWFAPMWAYMCGLVSSGVPFRNHWGVVALGVLVAGPLVCGTSQAANDWFDRHVDAINEPNRPIPSGRVPGRNGLYFALLWTIVSMVLAWGLGPFGFGAAIVGMILAWAYSTPPIRLKQDGWLGNLACGACYEGLPWITGAAVMTGGQPDWRILGVAALYSLGAHGIMTLNDFKSIEGDRQIGIETLPVQLGADNAGVVACIFMAAAQVLVILLLQSWGFPYYALAVLGLLLVQIGLMHWLLQKPKERAPAYNGSGTTLYVIGMLVTAFALRT